MVFQISPNRLSNISQEEEGGQEGKGYMEIARGGPIFVPNLVGPLTRVPEFESALLHQLQVLKNELCLDSSLSPNNHDIDISVDDIKPLTDDDLVEMALNDAPPLPNLQDRQKDASPGRGEDTSLASEPSNEGHCCNASVANENPNKPKVSSKSSGSSRATGRFTESTNKNTSRKRKGRNSSKHAIDESCLAKVSELLKIKEKQQQDKAAARLNSLNCQISKNMVPSLERIESMKYLRSTYFERQQSKPQNAQEHIALQHPEFVLCIEVYHNIRTWIKTQEFMVLGRQMLTELRDKIYCMTDQVMQKAGHHDPSGYFLVEDVFCNDTRNASAIDYSEPIFDWLRNSKDEALRKWECITNGEFGRKHKALLGGLPTSRLPQFRRIDMQKLRFCDLKFRLGAGYLYCHQGGCKHTIVIRDMRLVHPEDLQNRAAYPITIFQLKPRIRKCCVCGIFRAKKVTVDDKWTPHNPCYFCDDCYYLLHYNENNSLLYTDFSTYDYVHDLPD